MVSAWRCRESRYCQSAELVTPVEAASRYLLAAQHPDGTIDLVSTNFHSTPDTAFLFDHLAPAIELLRLAKWAPANPLLLNPEKFTRNAAEALTAADVHTRNHRWVV